MSFSRWISDRGSPLSTSKGSPARAAVISCARRLHSGRKLLPERTLEMTIGILQALEYSHRAGIV
ncbi:hypothetical protein ACWDA9_34255, partial [Streptomyces sp. NPDC001193]